MLQTTVRRNENLDRVQVTVRRRILKPEIIDFIAKADQTYNLIQRERIALGTHRPARVSAVLADA